MDVCSGVMLGAVSGFFVRYRFRSLSADCWFRLCCVLRICWSGCCD